MAYSKSEGGPLRARKQKIIPKPSPPLKLWLMRGNVSGNYKFYVRESRPDRNVISLQLADTTVCPTFFEKVTLPELHMAENSREVIEIQLVPVKPKKANAK